MGINYYFIRAVYEWPELEENPTYPVREDMNEWYLASSWTFVHYLYDNLYWKNTSFDMTLVSF